jgi:hypothetical protein
VNAIAAAKGYDEDYLWQFPPVNLAITSQPIFRGDAKSPYSKLDKQITIVQDAKVSL